MLEIDNSDRVSVKNTYMENTDLFKVNEIDIDKIRVSKRYFYKKEHESYKHYVFYEHNDEYILLKIIYVMWLDTTIRLMILVLKK